MYGRVFSGLKEEVKKNYLLNELIIILQVSLYVRHVLSMGRMYRVFNCCWSLYVLETEIWYGLLFGKVSMSLLFFAESL